MVSPWCERKGRGTQQSVGGTIGGPDDRGADQPPVAPAGLGERGEGGPLLRLQAPAGRHLTGTGALVNLDFLTFIGDTMQTAMPFTLITPNRVCTEIATTAGAAALDSI
ncbi:hypothetical protein I6F37_39795, partial [Bradyrhizobium sp. NBAIM08]|nr:hypothetical protein [Bradyrhizobium sp. NBAIM08]